MFRRPLCFIRSLAAQDINAFRRGESEHTARKARLSVQTAKADAGLAARVISQLHGGKVIILETGVNILIAGVVFLRRSQNVVNAVGRAAFLQRVAAVQCGFIGGNGGRAIVGGLAL